MANALTGVRGVLEILAARASAGPDAEFARAAINDLRRADALLHDASTYAAPHPLDTCTVAVSRLIVEALEQANQLTSPSRVRINIMQMDTVRVDADVTQLVRALAEVMRNAVEAGLATTEVRITRSLERDVVLIEVTNDASTTTPIDARAFEPLLPTGSDQCQARVISSKPSGGPPFIRATACSIAKRTRCSRSWQTPRSTAPLGLLRRADGGRSAHHRRPRPAQAPAHRRRGPPGGDHAAL